MGDMAGYLGQGDPFGGKRERFRVFVPGLFLETAVVDGPPVQARGGSGLQPSQGKAEIPQLSRKPHRRRVSHAAGGKMIEPDVDQAPHKGPGGKDHGPGPESFMDTGLHPVYPAVPHQQPVHHGLADGQPGLGLQHRFHAPSVQVPVILGPGALDRDPLPGVEPPELDAGGVGIFGHLPAQRIDLLHQVALGQPPDGRVAAHGGDVVQVDGQEQGRMPHPRGGQGRLASRVAGPDHDDIICLVKSGHA